MPRLLKRKAAEKLLPIFDPLFNLRECAKHLILLEDHLFHRDRRCPDCIRKHILSVEAFADEMCSLDKESKHTEICMDITAFTRGLYSNLDDLDHCGVGQECRELRKRIVKML